MRVKEFRAFLDRIEGDKAVLLLGEEERSRVVLPRTFLPAEAEEGALLTIVIRYEAEETGEASKQVSELIEKLTGSGDD